MLLIKNGYIKTMTGDDIRGGSILIGDDGKIAAVGTVVAMPANCEIIDADGALVTPGLVEAHCHVGLHDMAMGWEGADYNEKSDPITPQMRAIDSIFPRDEAFSLARSYGVTTLCTGPGSTNVVGGTFTAIKTVGDRVEDMIIKEAVAMKCAFGENPKRTYGQSSKKNPFTRMATAALLRELLFKSRRYLEDKEAGKNPPFDMKLEAMIPVLEGELPLKAHAHRADDILTSIRIAKEFDVKLTLDHCTEGHLMADTLAAEGYPAFVGPSFGSKSKVELSEKTFATAGILHKAGVSVSIITDAPVIPINYLPLCAGLAAAHGLPYEEAWRAITVNPATHMGLIDRVGTLEVGKDADIVIWSADPLTTVGASAKLTLINGNIVHQHG